MVMSNFDKSFSKPPTGYDPASIQEKIKQFRFAKPIDLSTKDGNWFKNLNGNAVPDNESSVSKPPVRSKIGLTEEDER